MDKHPIDTTDGGYASRKFWFSVGTSCAIAIAGLGCAKWPALVGVYPMYIGGMLAVLGAYCGANIGAKVVTGKQAMAFGSGDVGSAATELAPLILPGQPVEQLPPDHDE